MCPAWPGIRGCLRRKDVRNRLYFGRGIGGLLLVARRVLECPTRESILTGSWTRRPWCDCHRCRPSSARGATPTWRPCRPSPGFAIGAASRFRPPRGRAPSELRCPSELHRAVLHSAAPDGCLTSGAPAPTVDRKAWPRRDGRRCCWRTGSRCSTWAGATSTPSAPAATSTKPSCYGKAARLGDVSAAERLSLADPDAGFSLLPGPVAPPPLA